MSSETNQVNSCAPQFNADVQFSCILDLIKDARNGVSKDLIIKALWIGGSIFSKYGSQDDVTTADVVEFQSLEEALAMFDAQLALNENTIQVDGGPIMSDQTWWIPIVISIIELILKNRKG